MANGMSIHIGLNRVDPKKYQGWSGDLVACEADANDMEALAEARGFATRKKILTKAATSETVINAIEEAAATLKSGDILMLTYSGHGGQLPDVDDEEDDHLDETWVLYDRQLVDDELFHLFGRFEAGVRIIMLSDSCHSGTVARALPDFLKPSVLEARFGSADPDEIVKRVRAMPKEIAVRDYEKRKTMYDEIQRKAPAGDLVEIGASVLLISGCQDEQTSADGDNNGLFTGTLLEVWHDGAFKGGYSKFVHEIVTRMPIDQKPWLFPEGTRNARFRRQNPFTV
jgi:metacaspase-1